MTPHQAAAVSEFLERPDVEELHEGDCVGADAQAAAIALALGDVTIVAHPPTIGDHRAYAFAHEWREPKDYIPRNHDIVDETELLLATPGLSYEEQRSGTWATVRYARNCDRSVVVFWPDGHTTWDLGTMRIPDGR